MVMSQRLVLQVTVAGFRETTFRPEIQELGHGNHIILRWNTKGNIKGTATALSGPFHQDIGASAQGLE